jgi:hypothetical protein
MYSQGNQLALQVLLTELIPGLSEAYTIIHDTIITGSYVTKVDATISSISELFNTTSEDQVNDLMGINISHQDDGKFYSHSQS